MSLFEKLKNLFRKPAPQEKPAEAPKTPERLQKTCKKCGKTFSYDPSLDFVPNFCRECKKRHDAEKEEKQRAGAPRKISRKCKACGGS